MTRKATPLVQIMVTRYGDEGPWLIYLGPHSPFVADPSHAPAQTLADRYTAAAIGTPPDLQVTVTDRETGATAEARGKDVILTIPSVMPDANASRLLHDARAILGIANRQATATIRFYPAGGKDRGAQEPRACRTEGSTMSRARHGFRHAARSVVASASAAILIALGAAAPASVQPVSAAGDFQLLVTPADQLLPPGGSVSFLVQVGSVGGFVDEVTLSVGTLPAGVTYQLSDDTVTPPATEHLTLIASEDAEVGAFPVVVTGRSGAIEHVASGSVTVDFGLVPVCYAKIKGTVTDRTTGDAIEGVKISNLGEVFTDAQGHYSFDKVGLGVNNAPSSFQLMATKNGYWSSFSEEAHFVCAQETTVDFTMLAWIPGAAHGRIVEGTVDPNDPAVVMPGQTPIAGIGVGFEVSLIPGSGPDTTGPDGLFQLSLDHLGPENTPFGLTLFAQEPVNFTDQIYWPRGGSTPSPIRLGEVGPNDDVNVGDIGMVRKCFGSVTGTLKYGDTNEPAVGVTVTAQHFWWFSSDTTDATGAYDIPIVSLAYNNQPTDVGLIASDTTGFYESVQGTTHFDACGDAKVVPLVFEPINLGSLEGRVTDEETDEVLPDAQVAFRFAPCPTCDPYPGLADGNGDYRIDRIPAAEPPGVASYSTEADYPGYWWTIHSVDIFPGTVTHRDFELLRKKFASLRGRVIDAITGDPIEGAQGGAQHGTTGATTLADGTYMQSNLDIGYRNESLTGSVRFGADGYWPVQAPATFEANKETVVNLEMIPICDGATIRGRVVDATNQQPLEGASIVVGGNGQDFTDPNGRYEITGIQVGDNNSPISVTVFASKEGYFSQSRVITVFCGASISIDFGRRPAHLGALEGFVTNAATGDPIPNVKIVGAFGEEATTDADGHYLFPEVPVNDDGSERSWDVSALPSGFEHQTKSVTVRADETARLDFQFGGVQPPASGKIVVKVDTLPPGSTQSFTFTPSYGSTFSLTDGQSNDSGLIEAGKTYSVSQAAVPGWDTTSSCDHGQTPGSIALAADTTVTCTFQNVQRATIVVTKTAVGGNGDFSFTSQTLGNFSITTVGGTGSRTFSNLVPDTYGVAEPTPPSGWDLASATCSGGKTPASFAIDPGQTVTCTFTNNKRGSASVAKTVSGKAPSGTQAFAFQLRQGASTTAAGTVLASGTANAGNAGVVSFSPSLVPGATYQLCEAVLPGWISSVGPNPFVVFDPSGDNSTICADFTVQPGQAKMLAVDNTQTATAGQPHTLGFWKNHSSCANSNGKQEPILDRTLASTEPGGLLIGRLTLHGSTSKPDKAPSCTAAVNLLNKTTIDGKKKVSSDPAFNMAAQLLAADLNILAKARTCQAANSAIADGQALLYAVNFNGLTHTTLTSAQATQANNLATILDRYNNGLLC
jgi:carboxypeptidase family protein